MTILFERYPLSLIIEMVHRLHFG